MKPSLKPLDQQVIVITGASSGIGLATALAAAKQGARLVLAARSKVTLDEVVAQLEAAGAEAVACEADVGHRSQVERVAAAAFERFFRIDTWSTTPGCRSTAASTKSATRMTGACSRPTSGALSTARRSPCRTCATTAAR